MNEALDRETLDLVARLIGNENGDAMLVQHLWHERSALIQALLLIRDWDMGHSEALSIERVQSIVHDALLVVGEE
jgi:hypothetical protein